MSTVSYTPEDYSAASDILADEYVNLYDTGELNNSMSNDEFVEVLWVKTQLNKDIVARWVDSNNDPANKYE